MTALDPADLVREIEHRQPDVRSSLTHLSAAVLAAEHLAEVGDSVVDHFVQRARADGASWADIGQCMGVSKQAVQKRFVAARREPGSGAGHFAEFDPEVRYLVQRAGAEARLLGHSYIGTEHLVLGLLRIGDDLDDGPGSTGATIAARVLAGAGVRLEPARALAERLVGRGGGSPDGSIPLTPRCKKTCQLALDECRARRGAVPDARDLLLGVLREGRGVGAQLLQGLAADPAGLRERVLAAS